MKKLSYIILLAISMIAISACSSDNEASTASGEKQESQQTTEEKSLEVDKGLLNVEVTLPVSMFEGEDIDQVIADAKADGVEEVTKNEDGSLTYRMSKSKHKEMMQEIEKSIKESLEDMKTSGDFASIKDITHNDSFSEFTLTVDKAEYENSMDAFGVFGLGISGMIYQLYNGGDNENTKVIISVEDQATQEVFDTIVYPDDMENTEN
ncbi:hypothetical protein [Jeotgalibacillus soli]|uniref:Antigen I/II N-terminal domain-containing protein n=1 Tax=Jeotgalibacillus soli TaxID=889306 RepID=A0A0C2V0W4_9BACL|nr:hypothetical protein [Jeotgalibacillus soli]KIL42707.1 hypothetical protein KP78_39300 [Jeotgalibacillus soli]